MTQSKKAVRDVAGMSEEAIVDSILTNMPKSDYVDVDLPSKGKFYDGSPTIQVRPMTFADEKVVMSNANVNKDTLNLLLARCIRGINISELMIVDKLFLVMKLREVSYGGEYGAMVPCPECSHDNNLMFDISILNVNYIPDDMTDPTEIKLPVIDKKVTVKLPRVSDEKYLKNFDLVSENLWRFIEEIDGFSQKTIISKVVGQLPIKDVHSIVKALGTADYGLDSKVRLVCNNCSKHSMIDLPISSDFFMGN